MNMISNVKQGYVNFKELDKKDKFNFCKEALINNALYILLIIAVIYTYTQNQRFLTVNSIVNIVSLSAANIPIACGIAGCIVLTGTDLSAGRVVGLTACISASLLQSATYATKMFPGLPVLPIPLVILIVIIVGGIIGQWFLRCKIPVASIHCNISNSVNCIWFIINVYHDQWKQRSTSFRIR